LILSFSEAATLDFDFTMPRNLSPRKVAAQFLFHMLLPAILISFSDSC